MSKMIDTPLGKKNMDFIVKCLSSHDALIEALEAALNTIKALDEDYDIRDSYRNGRAALAKAKE